MCFALQATEAIREYEKSKKLPPVKIIAMSACNFEWIECAFYEIALESNNILTKENHLCFLLCFEELSSFLKMDFFLLHFCS